MPAYVVHVLEAVEVDRDEGERLARAPRAAERLLDAIVEQHTVRKSGEWVAERFRVSVFEAPIENDPCGGGDERANRTRAAATWSGVSRKTAVNRLAQSTSAARHSAHTNVLLSCRRLVLIVTRRRSAPVSGPPQLIPTVLPNRRATIPSTSDLLPRRRDAHASRRAEGARVSSRNPGGWTSLRASSGFF